MALIDMDFALGMGGGSDHWYMVHFTGTKPNVTITGKAKKIMVVEYRGWMYTNFNIEDDSEIYDDKLTHNSSINPWSGTPSIDTDNWFIRTEGNITTNTNLSVQSQEYYMFYTLE